MRISTACTSKNQNDSLSRNQQIQKGVPQVKTKCMRRLISRRSNGKRNQRISLRNKYRHDKFSSKISLNESTQIQHSLSIDSTTQPSQNTSSLNKNELCQEFQESASIPFNLNSLSKNSNFDSKRSNQQKVDLEEIYNYFLNKEPEFIPKVILEFKTITEVNRTKLMVWIFEMSERFQFKQETAYSAINIIDRSLGLFKINLQRLPLLGITALFMATKYQQILIPQLDNFVSMVPPVYNVTKELVIQLESVILKELSFSLGYISPLLFVYCFDKISPLPTLMKNRSIALIKEYILRSDCRYLPSSKIAAIAIKEAQQNYQSMINSSSSTSFIEFGMLKI